MLHFRRHILVSVIACCSLLSACTDIPAERVQTTTPTTALEIETPVTTTTTTTVNPAPWYRAVVAQERWFAIVRWYENAAAGSSETAGRGLSPRQQSPVRGYAPAAAPSIANVLACIKSYESGDYNEHSHLGSGSGAYQYVPGTWRTWSARAGYPGYAYAYLAPPSVQDAVTVYTLTNGGAGNWSNRWGSDPCTSGLLGGG